MSIILDSELIWGISSLVFYSCTDAVETELAELGYKEPINSLELEALLNESSSSVLMKLDKDSEKSLVEYAIFYDNRMRGFEKEVDANIKYLNKTNMLEVLSAILQREVVSPEQYESLEGLKIAIPPYSYCENCWWFRDPDGCCHVGGEGCIDYN